MRLPAVCSGVFTPIRVLALASLLLLGAASSANARFYSGWIGLFLDPAGTVSYVDSGNSGDHSDLVEVLPDGGLRYTVYVLGKDLPRGTSAYEFALKPAYWAGGYWNSPPLLSPSFPEAAEYWEWSSTGIEPYTTQINYAVELGECLPAEGLITLATIEVQYNYLDSFVLFVELAEARTNSTVVYDYGYRPCDAAGPFVRLPLPLGQTEAGVYLPDPAAELSWGQMKAQFR